MKMNPKTKILIGLLVIGILLLSGCVEKPPVTTTTTVPATTITSPVTTTSIVSSTSTTPTTTTIEGNMQETENLSKELENKSEEEIKQEAYEYYNIARESYFRADYKNALRYALMARDLYEYLNESEFVSRADQIIKRIC